MLGDVIAATNAKLVTYPGVSCFTGKKHLADHGAPPRFVWVPFARESVVSKTSGGNPKTLQTSQWQLAVHCWGVDFEQAERMEQALLTCLRQVSQGASVTHLHTEPLPDESTWTQRGYVLVCLLRVEVPLPEGKVGAFGDLSFQTVTPNAVAFDPTGAVAGDGTLQAGEPDS